MYIAIKPSYVYNCKIIAFSYYIKKKIFTYSICNDEIDQLIRQLTKTSTNRLCRTIVIKTLMQPTKRSRSLWQIFHYVLSFHFHQTKINNKVLTRLHLFVVLTALHLFKSLIKIYTYNNIVITPIALTARGTLPVLIPDMSAIGHIVPLQPFAFPFSGTFFRNVKLFLGTLRPIWCTYNHQTSLH